MRRGEGMSSGVLSLARVAVGVFLVWSVCGCPAANPPTGNRNDNGSSQQKAFVGASACLDCHENAHTAWAATAHSRAWSSLTSIGQETNTQCIPCHTVGFGEPDGFVSAEATPELAGVQCENCHGPSGAHVRNPSDEALRPPIDLSAETSCGVCHNDVHHPTFDEWGLSKHAAALATLQSRPFAQASCLECHSQDYRYALEKGMEPPTVATARFAIECVTCHSPHGGTAEVAQLRHPVGNLCGECHTQEEAAIGDTPHHPQFEMLKGTGAFNADGSPLVRSTSHSVLAAGGGQACAQCHVVRHDVQDPTQEDPVVTGHTFNPFDESITQHQADQYTGCLICHDTDTAALLRANLQGEISSRLAALAPRFDPESPSFIDPSSLNEGDRTRLSTAKFDFEFVGADGSRGVHNEKYARALLDVTESIVSEMITTNGATTD